MTPLSSLTTSGNSRIYRRETIDQLPPAACGSTAYSRSVAKRLFDGHPEVCLVEYVSSARKTDSQIIGRGSTHAPIGVLVYVASSGGKWGKSKRVFYPVK
jgi:hypothetical protein